MRSTTCMVYLTFGVPARLTSLTSSESITISTIPCRKPTSTQSGAAAAFVGVVQSINDKRHSGFFELRCADVAAGGLGFLWHPLATFLDGRAPAAQGSHEFFALANRHAD
jgi:hypothetical protein